MKRVLLVVLAAILLLTVAACASNKAPIADQPAATKSSAGAEKASPTSASSKPAATTAPKATAKSESADSPTAVAPAGTPTDEGFTLDSRETGLEKLKSYRMRWLAEWTGTDSGTSESGSWSWVEEYVAEPRGLHWVWDFKDPKDETKSGQMEWWQVGETTYMKMDAESCISMSSQESSSQLSQGLFSPDMLGKVDKAQYLGDETVNGIRAKHYKYNEKGASLSSFGEVAGEIWVAIDGGFVVKDIVAWKGGAGLFGSGGATGTKGEGKWTWELTDVDKPITITPPENCGGAANDIPVMPGAKEKSTFGDMITYKVTAAIADVVTFYRTEMKAAGWEEQDDAMTTEEMASINFKKDEQTAQVLITKDDNETQVMISVTK